MGELIDFFKSVLSDPLADFLSTHSRSGLADHSGPLIGVLIVVLVAIALGLRKLIIFLYHWIVAWRLASDLRPLFSHLDVVKATGNYIHSRFQSVSPATYDEPGKSATMVASERLIPWMKETLKLTNSHQR